jgi:hypothetical protein
MSMSEIKWDEAIEAVAMHAADGEPVPARLVAKYERFAVAEVGSGQNAFPFKLNGERLLLSTGWQIRNVAPIAPADGWTVANNSCGYYIVRREPSPDQYIYTDGHIGDGGCYTYFPSHSEAAAALAKWREGQREPDPHRPCEGVELRRNGGLRDYFVLVDGKPAAHGTTAFFREWLSGDEPVRALIEPPNDLPISLNEIPALVALRDRIRAERKAKAAPDHSRGVTPKGREWTATCGAGSVFIVTGSDCWWLKNDGTVCKQSDGSAETAHRFAPNTKPIPASALAEIDRILDAKAAEEAKPKPFTAETWPKDAWLRVRGGTIQHRAAAITREGIFTIDYTAAKPTDGRVCFISFTAMKDPDGFEMSTDGLTWRPAYQQEKK